jgi:hypothetical protein
MPDRGKEKRKRILECIKGVDFTTARVGHNRWLVLCWTDGASEFSEGDIAKESLMSLPFGTV